MSHDDFSQLPGDSVAAQRQAELIALTERFTPVEGVNDTAVAPLHLIRANAPSQRMGALYEPCICVVIQGRKQALIGSDKVIYDPLRYLFVSVTLPAVGEILEASPERPYLCARIDIDPREIGTLILDAGAAAPATDDDGRGLRVAPLSDELLDVLLRLLRLLDSPRDLPVLAPLALREIFYRVLTGAFGPQLRALALADGRAQRIADAIELLKRHYAETIRIEELAGAVNMSPSSLHHRFKAVTAMSPLQFQKQLRLHEARRLILTEGLEITAAGHRVGYASPSQFSREYRRVFGVSPREEIAQLRSA